MVRNHQKTPKLKPLLEDVPPGFYVDAAWLVARKIDRKSIHDYAKRGWLESVVRGLYRRPFTSAEDPGSRTSWVIPVLSMQWLMHYDVHVGGKTALAVRGHTHYLNLGERETIFLYGSDIPTWLKRLPTRHVFKTRTRALFGGDTAGIEKLSNRNGFTDSRWPLTVSSPERAVLELINELPNKETFDTVDTLFQGLANLRPKRLHELLMLCNSIKVKRLFFVFADRHNHAWRKHLDTGAYNLGSGPRGLIKGGRMHPVYRIAVPEAYVSTEGVDDGP